MLAEAAREITNDDQGVENENALNMNYYNIKKASLVLRSLNHKLRQQIIKLIYESEKLTAGIFCYY